MQLELILPPGCSPVLRLYHWQTGVLVGSPIDGTAVSGRTFRYRFDLTGIAVGKYSVDNVDPLGGFNMEITATEVRICDEWWQISATLQLIIAPTIGSGSQDMASQELEAPIDADFVIARSVVDGNGAPVTLPNDCYFVLCDENEVHLIDINPIVSGSSYNATVPRAHTKLQRTIHFALRSNAADNKALDYGTITFGYAATES